MQYDDVITNSRCRTDAILKIVFLAISRRRIGRSTRNLNRYEGSHADIGHVTKTAIFANSRWRSATILKIALSPYLSCELSDVDQIWYTDTNFHSEHVNLTKKSKIFKFKMADGRHFENSFISISQL